MRGRTLLAGALLSVAAMGAASASSLGDFEAVALGTVTRNVAVCTAGEADLLDAAGNVIPLSLPNLYEIGGVRLTGLDDSCVGTTPIVVVVGQDPWLVNADEVLAVKYHSSTIPAGVSSLDLDVISGDALDLLTLTSVTVATEVRVAFCPSGQTCT